MSVMTATIARRDLYDHDTYELVTLDLPASKGQIEDALHQARCYNNADFVVFDAMSNMECFADLMPLHPKLDELNFLAKRLEVMTDEDRLGFEVLIKAEKAKPDLARLINMTYNTENVQVISNVKNDAELGHFYFDHDFVAELEKLPEGAERFLDFSKIGKEWREGENGVFIGNSYGFNMDGELEIIYDGINLPGGAPQGDYVFKLELAKGSFEPENAKRVLLDLPSYLDEIDNALTKLGIKSIDECVLTSYDSRLPILSEKFGFAEDIHKINTLAQLLDELPDGQSLAKFKAAFQFTNCTDIDFAIDIAKNLDCFDLDTDTALPQEYGKAYLQSLGVDIKAQAFRYFDFGDYGDERLKSDNAWMSPYGVIKRNDNEFVQSITVQNGMNMG